jgi:DivIVA domain-containing protein
MGRMGRFGDIHKTQDRAWEGLHAGRGGRVPEEIRDTFLGATKSPAKFRRRLGQRSSSPEWREIPNGVRGAHFSSPSSEGLRGYDEKQVHALLDAAGIRLAAMESVDRPAGPLVSEAILAGWAAWADSTTFSTRRRRDGYDKAEVDAFVEAIRDEFLVRRTPLTGMLPTASGSRLPSLATTWSRSMPSLTRPNRSWLRCGRPTGDDATEAPTGSAGAFLQSGREFMLTQ